MSRKRTVWMAAAVIGVVSIAAACDQGTTSPRVDGTTVVPGGLQFAVGDVIAKPAATELGERYVICKSGPSSTFNVSAGSLSGGPFTVNGGDCKIAYEMGGATVTISSSENVPAGVQLDSVRVTQLTCGLGLGDECDPGSFPDVTGPTKVYTGPLAGPATSSSFSGYVGGTGPSSDRSVKGLSGVLVEYFNSLIPTGGEGCTPGFWKNHTGAWMGASSGDLFTSVGFTAAWSPANPEGSVNPSTMTLLRALELRGGGINSLVRHAVAAWLNASHTGVDYDLTAGEVVTLFNDAVSGGTVDAAKYELEGYNEQGCPLGAADF